MDSKSGNNLLYLPLDKLNTKSNQTSSSQFDPASTALVEQQIRKRQAEGNIRNSVRNGTRSTR